MKKKLAIIIPVVAIILAVVTATSVHMSLINDIEVGISAPMDDNTQTYFQMIMFGYPGMLKGKKVEQIKQVSDDINNFTVAFFAEQEKPYYIETKYENIDKKTVITYKGEVTDKETGELVEFNKVFTYDFFITDNITTNFPDYKYFN